MLKPAILLLICAAVSAFGENSPDAPTITAFDHFYNLEYEQATQEFRDIVAAQPDRPSSWNHLAQVLFYDSLYRAGLMGSDLIKTNDAMIKAPKLTMSPARDEEIRGALAKSIGLCDEALKRNPGDADAFYELGNAYALRANYVFLVKHAWLEGLKDANQSRRIHEQLMKMDPENYDARLIPGTHEYMIGTLPLIVRMFARTAGLSGNREEGLRKVEQAARYGRLARADAEILLPVLYRREKRSQDGIPGMRKLTDEYPRNFLFRIELAKLYADAGQKAQAEAELHHIQDLVDRKAPGYGGDRVPVIRQKQAEVARFLDTVDPDRAIARSHRAPRNSQALR